MKKSELNELLIEAAELFIKRLEEDGQNIYNTHYTYKNISLYISKDTLKDSIKHNYFHMVFANIEYNYVGDLKMHFGNDSECSKYPNLSHVIMPDMRKWIETVIHLLKTNPDEFPEYGINDFALIFTMGNNEEK